MAAVLSDYVNGICSYALVLSRNHAEAEDRMQGTYLRAFPAMCRLRPDGNVKGWLSRILRHVWLNQVRKSRNSPELLQTDTESSPAGNVADPGYDSYQIYANEMERQRVQAAIQELSTASREIVQLREFDELSYQYIASVLDCPAGTVMSRLARARSKPRVLLSSTSNGRKRTRIVC